MLRARLKAEGIFGIRGRGIVIAGFIIEGKIRIGMTVSIPTFPRKLTLRGVEMIKRLDGVMGEFGLLFSFWDLSDTEAALLINSNLKNKIIEIEDE